MKANTIYRKFFFNYMVPIHVAITDWLSQYKYIIKRVITHLVYLNAIEPLVGFTISFRSYFYKSYLEVTMIGQCLIVSAHVHVYIYK